MKKIVLSTLFILALMLGNINLSYSQDPGSPPPPPDNPGSNNGPVGGGAPVGEALVFTVLLAAGYGAKKYYSRHKRSISED